MKYTTVRVVDSGGHPQRDIKVSINVHQFGAGGMIGPEYTNRDGEADFRLDIDEYAEISVYVQGNEAVSRGSVKSDYVCRL